MMSCNITQISPFHLREHHVQRYPQLFGTAQVHKAGRVRDNSVGNKWSCTGVNSSTIRIFRVMAHFRSISCLIARTPTSRENRFHFASALLYRAAADGAHTWQQARVLDHKCHQLFGIATNIEELESHLNNIFAERQMGGKSNSMSVLLEFLAQSHEWLDITARSNNLYDDIQAQRERETIFGYDI